MPTLQKNLDAVEEKLKELLTPRDPNDEKKNVILEIRAGTGGEEAFVICRRPVTGCTRAMPNVTDSSSKRSA